MEIRAWNVSNAINKEQFTPSNVVRDLLAF